MPTLVIVRRPRTARSVTQTVRMRFLVGTGAALRATGTRRGIYVDDRRKHALSPLRLARLLCRWRPAFTRRTVDRIDSVSEPEIRAAIQRVPPEFMSDIAKEFSCQVVMASKEELLRSVR